MVPKIWNKEVNKTEDKGYGGQPCPPGGLWHQGVLAVLCFVGDKRGRGKDLADSKALCFLVSILLT